MADKKIVTHDVLEKSISDVLQIIADNVYINEEYTTDEVDNMFNGTSEEIAYYSSLINDNLVSENRLYSSKKIADEIAKAIIDSNAYADGLITNLSSIELKYVDSLPSAGNSNTIYILKAADSSSNDTLNLYNDGAWTVIGDFTISLDDYYTKSEMDTKLNDKANKTEVLSADNVLTTTGTETHDNVYSAQLTKSELDLKANDDEVVKKTDISTTIDSTSTNDKAAGAKAVHDSLANKLDKTVILTTADEVNSFDREYQSFIIEPSVADAVGLPKAPDSTWFCINLSHVKGFKYPSQIAFEYAGIERVMYRTAHNGVWHKWRKLCITSVADVYKTELKNTSTSYPNDTNSYYTVKNGWCQVSLSFLCVTAETNLVDVLTLPKPKMLTYAYGLPRNFNTDASKVPVFIFLTEGGALQMAYGSGDGTPYRCSFSYPVAE